MISGKAIYTNIAARFTAILLLICLAIIAVPGRTTADPTITTTSLPNGQVNSYYIAYLSATSSSVTVEWSLTAGSLPPGLTLAPHGVIQGTPTTMGSFSFTLTATDDLDSTS